VSDLLHLRAFNLGLRLDARTDDGKAVYSPCGSCRELLCDHGVARVVVAESPTAELTTATLPELLPWP
jgi:cytidine deaminase